MSENNIEKLGAAIASIEKSIGSALELGEKVTSLDADLQAVRKEQAEAVAALKADGQKIPEAVEKRLAEQERRLGKLNASSVGSEDADPSVKSIGGQFGDWLRENTEFVEKAKREGNLVKRSSFMPVKGSIRQQTDAVNMLKAMNIQPTDENVRKATAISDATNYSQVFRAPNLLPLPSRKLVLASLLPSRPISGNAYEYLEYLGMGEETAKSMTSITSVTTVATATTAAAHLLRVGDRVLISGANEAGYNGAVFVASVTGATTFTYAIDAATDDTATGTIVWRTLSRYGAAAPVSEAALKPSSRLSPTLKTGVCQVIAHLHKITRQALDDIPGIEADINMFGLRGLEEEKEYQLMYGDGSSPNLQGIMALSTRQTYTQATAGSVGRLSAPRHAITMIQNRGGMASAIVANPENWEEMELSVGLDDHFIFKGGLDGNNESIWRLPVVVTKSIAPDHLLVGAFAEGGVIFERQAANVAFADQNDTDFNYNLLSIRFEERLGVAWTRPEMFVDVTLL